MERKGKITSREREIENSHRLRQQREQKKRQQTDQHMTVEELQSADGVAERKRKTRGKENKRK